MQKEKAIQNSNPQSEELQLFSSDIYLNFINIYSKQNTTLVVVLFLKRDHHGNV